MGNTFSGWGVSPENLTLVLKLHRASSSFSRYGLCQTHFLVPSPQRRAVGTTERLSDPFF